MEARPPSRRSDRTAGRAHVPVARISAAAAIAVGAYLMLHGQGEPRWRSIGPGVEFTTLRGDPYCRRGSSGIGVLRLDPARAHVRVLHYTVTPGRAPLDIMDWQRLTGAVAVFNAGQFYPDLSYMGLLVCSGRVVSNEVHPGFKAALVAAPERGRPDVRVLDLSKNPLDPSAPQWREVAQSFMVLDSEGNLRVRKSDHVANRTLVAEDRGGRVLVFTTEGGYTLADCAEYLRRSPLGISRAMGMDGGLEAELCVRSGTFRYASFGSWDERHGEGNQPGARTPLPAVIVVDAN
ncbi:MAG: phosphodiester glycosidase family protein [Candidatus Eisenbacteria bacterium]|nr:phosphodiester glycosidase family protein [Candidatus Eisenbacteria bacterium]